VASERVERLGAAFAAFEAGDPSVFRELYHDEIELYVPSTAFEGGGLVHGKDAVIDWFREYQHAAFEDFRYDELELSEAGRTVVARYSTSFKARRSGLAARTEVVTVFAFSDEQVRAMAHFSEMLEETAPGSAAAPPR
jgi:ketosteroid isomerase-like protein